jgi:ferrous iron transport protein A
MLVAEVTRESDLDAQMQMDVAMTAFQGLELKETRFVFFAKMQMAFKKTARKKAIAEPRDLTELKRGEQGILERIDLPEDDARRLMEIGFLPGHTVTPAHAAPGGDPRVFRVDGSEIALRRETARKLILRATSARG